MKTLEIVNRAGALFCVLLDDADFEAVRAAGPWAVSPKDSRSRTHYVRRTTCEGGRKSCQALHRFLLRPEPGLQVDHVNGDGLDNRRENLRLATPSQNAHNKTKYARNTSGYKGVSQLKARPHKWFAQIRLSGKLKRIGTYDSPEEAYAAYCVAAEDMHKDFARTK